MNLKLYTRGLKELYFAVGLNLSIVRQICNCYVKEINCIESCFVDIACCKLQSVWIYKLHVLVYVRTYTCRLVEESANFHIFPFTNSFKKIYSFCLGDIPLSNCV